MKVLIAGGGVGGLTAALSLQQAGMDVKVFESVRNLAPLGVGINILPHASRELIALGLQRELDRFAIRTRAMSYFTRRGKAVISYPCGEYAGYHWPQYSLHRGEFQMLLLRVLRARAGPGSIQSGRRLVGFEQDETGVVARFAGPGADDVIHEETGDVLIGADGLHSTVRRQLYPDEGAPVFCGMICFRGAVVGAPYLDGETMIICGDQRQTLVSYPLSGPLCKQGKSLNNWIAALPFAIDEPQAEDWNKQTTADKLLQLYRDWNFDWLDVPALIAATAQVFEFPVYDRDPLGQWTFGRVTLLGDAAHPLMPVSSSGAVHAIIDARALAWALAGHDDAEAGLQAYQADRLPQANRVVVASRHNGPDEVLEIVRRECPDDADNVHDYVAKERLQAVIDTFKQRTGFVIDTLNNQPSYDVAIAD